MDGIALGRDEILILAHLQDLGSSWDEVVCVGGPNNNDGKN
jgi:hypothetical protein